MYSWYRQATVDQMEKEASFKEGVIITLISLLSGTAAWFEGNAIKNYLANKNVAQESFAQVVNTLNQTNKSVEEMDKSDIILAKDNYESQKSEEIPEDSYETNPNTKTRDELSPFDTIARTIYDEARGEGIDGMTAVSEVILNSSDGTPESLKNVCLKPWRFSGWNKGKFLQGGTGQAWETSKQLAKSVLSPTTKPNKNGKNFFCNPQLVIQTNGKKDGITNVPSLLTLDDLIALPDSYLKYLPTFMFKPVKQNLGKGAWKHIYPKTKQNLRTDFNTVGKQLFYSKDVQ